MRNNDFTDVVQNRHSVRNFNKCLKRQSLPLQAAICRAGILKCLIHLKALRELRDYMMKFNYPQMNSCAAIVQVFADVYAYKKYREMWTKTYEEGHITKEKLDEVLRTFLPSYENGTYDSCAIDAIRSCSLAAMQFMLVARNHGYDTNPIAGYDESQIARTFNLEPKRYLPVMAIAIGKSNETEETLAKTIRYPVEQVYHFAD